MIQRHRADTRITSLAATQHGIVTRAQLANAGISRHAVDHRVKAGLLRVLHAGVYQVGPVVSARAREMAAVLACGQGAISHRSAVPLCELGTARPAGEPVDVILPGGRHRGRRPGIRAHRVAIAPDEITRIDSIPVTSRARTLLDLSRVASPRELEHALATAERVDPACIDETASLLRRYSGHAGTRRLRDLLGGRSPRALTRSEAESRLLGMIRTAGLPEPETNVQLHGYEVDCYWRRARLVIEVDGYAFHASARAFQRDRRRDTALAAEGIHVLRLTWQQINDDRDRTLVQLARALTRAGS